MTRPRARRPPAARRAYELALVGGLLLTWLGSTASRAHTPADPPPQTAIADAERLRLIVAPARLRPGQIANVRITDRRGAGDVSARICARAGATTVPCRTLRLPAGQPRGQARVRLPRAGRWTIAVRSAAGQRIERPVEVRRDLRYRVLVAGDSMVYGIIDVLGRFVRRTGGTLRGDPHPGSAISKPAFLAWPKHARRTVRAYRPDATVAFLGTVDEFPLATGTGARTPCCGPAWVDAYVPQVRSMMSAYLRAGSGLVFWVMLPAPADTRRAESYAAINSAIRRAASTFADGVRPVDIAAVISPGDRYTETITHRGRRELVRDPDGIHLANRGVHIATEIILRAMRSDGVAPVP